MTKRLLLRLLTIYGVMCPALFVQAQDDSGESEKPAPPQIMDAATGERLESDVLANRIAPFEVIFLGEQHDNDSGHAMQLDLIKSLVDNDVDVVVSMEQFERDVQGVVDDYLADRISEDEFLSNSRPWKNYDKHYRPIVEFAKEKNIPVLAANIPRRLASDIAMSRTIKLADVVFLPRKTSAPENEYWQNFRETMKGHGGTDSAADGGKMLKRFYASQCAKDDTMAESITDYLAKNQHRQKIVVHLCGHFHSDYGLGTAARVVQRRPLIRIAVVTMETIPENNKLQVKGVRSRGHYIFWTENNRDKPAESPDEESPSDQSSSSSQDSTGDSTR